VAGAPEGGVGRPDKDRDYLEKVGRLQEPTDLIERLSFERDYGYEEELEAPER
jgi:hypothetical protein